MFYSLRSTCNERQYLLRNMMDCMERNKTGNNFSAGAQAIEHSILLLKRMMEEDSRLYVYNSKHRSHFCMTQTRKFNLIDSDIFYARMANYLEEKYYLENSL